MRGVLYLASTSPRRQELLRQAGIRFRLHPPGPEPVGRGAPAARATQRARAKAVEAPPVPAPGEILGVDTLVVCDGDELGKPADRAAAAAMLARLSGREHEVVTAHCLFDPATGRIGADLAVARVRCAALTPARIAAYLDRGDWSDKAGAYGIQGDAGAFMELIAGALDTVVGLHVPAVRRLWEER